MDDTNKITSTPATPQAPAQPSTLTQDKEAALKAKYADKKLYRVGVTVPIDDDEEQEFSYYFKRPSVPSYDRYVKSVAKAGITKASKAFMLDNVIDEDKERLTADMEEYPGVAISIGNKLTDILGLSDANLKRV